MTRIVNLSEDKAKTAADNEIKVEHDDILKKYEYAGPEWFRENAIKQFNTFSAAKDAVVRSVIVNNMNRIRVAFPGEYGEICSVGAMNDNGFQLVSRDNDFDPSKLSDDGWIWYQKVIALGRDGNDTVLFLDRHGF